MKLLYFLFSSLCTVLIANNDYEKILEESQVVLGSNGSWKRGEIEIVTAPNDINRIETEMKNRLIARGYTPGKAEEYSKTGIVAEDQYFIWIRDAVLFPENKPGTYDRIFLQSGRTAPAGAAVLPVLTNGKILVNVNYRHATRSWEIELPRGMRKKDETIEQAAARELQEETGYSSNTLIFLGNIAPDSGIIAGFVPIFLGKIDKYKGQNQEESEAIAKIIALTKEQLQEAFLKGFITLDVRGEKTKVYCRDPFLSYALLQAMWRNLL